MHPKVAHLKLSDGRVERLERSGKVGTTSVRFANARYILKINDDEHLARREACVLGLLGRRTRRHGHVPHLVCSSSRALLFETAGVPLQVGNIPPDYRQQMDRILACAANTLVPSGPARFI
jgi:hypothetical protein